MGLSYKFITHCDNGHELDISAQSDDGIKKCRVCDLEQLKELHSKYDMWYKVQNAKFTLLREKFEEVDDAVIELDSNIGDPAFSAQLDSAILAMKRVQEELTRAKIIVQSSLILILRRCEGFTQRWGDMTATERSQVITPGMEARHPIVFSDEFELPDTTSDGSSDSSADSSSPSDTGSLFRPPMDR